VTLLFSNISANLVTEEDGQMFSEAVKSQLAELLSICRQMFVSAIFSRENNSVCVTALFNGMYIQFEMH